MARTSSAIGVLSDSTSASVRAGQVIGSIPRAIEEIVRNSILHGRATSVDVLIGSNAAHSNSLLQNRHSSNRNEISRRITGERMSHILEVRDNGTGIDLESMRLLIGTEHCSSSTCDIDARKSYRNDDHDFGEPNFSVRGESLKALTSLCIDMKISTTTSKMKTKAKRGQNHEPSRERSSTQSSTVLVSSEKVFHNGQVTSFQTSSSMPPININLQDNLSKISMTGTGTTIKIHGLFHRHAVRRKKYQSQYQQSSSSTNIIDDRTNLAQARGCIQLLAMAFPNVNIQLFQIRSNGPEFAILTKTERRLALETSWIAAHPCRHDLETSLTSTHLSLKIGRSSTQNKICLQQSTSSCCATTESLKQNLSNNESILPFCTRLEQLCGMDINPSSFLVDILYEEGQKDHDVSKQIKKEPDSKYHQARNNSVQTTSYSSKCLPSKKRKLEYLHCSSSSVSPPVASKQKKNFHRNVHYYKNAKKWKVSGAILFQGEEGVETSVSSVTNRNRQNEFIFVNQRLSKNNSSLMDLVHSIISSYHRVQKNDNKRSRQSWSSHLNDGREKVDEHMNEKGTFPSEYRVYILLHVFCPFQDTTLVMDEIKSFTSVLQKERIEKLLCDATHHSMLRHGFVLKMGNKTRGEKSIKSDCAIETKQACSVIRQQVLRNDKLLHGSDMSISRIITSQPIQRDKGPKTGEDKGALSSICSTGSYLNEHPPFVVKSTIASGDTIHDTSPRVTFEDAFYSTNTKSAIVHAMKSIDKSKDTLLQIPNQADDDFDARDMTWTRARLKTFQSKIKSSTSQPLGNAARPITLTKNMLSKAKFIAQLDAKFIIIKCGTILCIVDQHAADERVGLEHLERALDVNLHTRDNVDIAGDFSIDLSKRKGIKVQEDLIKSIPLLNHHQSTIHLSNAQSEIVQEHKELLFQWYFHFEMPEEGRNTLTLLTVPAVCNKVASPNDFLQFIQAIGNRTQSDASLVKPAFVKRVLSSYACRYAIMFGDFISDEKCEELIQSLSKCTLSFICAHGRPSVVPLADLSLIETQHSSSLFVQRQKLVTRYAVVGNSSLVKPLEHTTNTSTIKNKAMPLRFRPRK